LRSQARRLATLVVLLGSGCTCPRTIATLAGDGVISEGTSATEVLELVGEPDRRLVPHDMDGVEFWTYYEGVSGIPPFCSGSQAQQALMIERGRVVLDGDVLVWAALDEERVLR